MPSFSMRSRKSGSRIASLPVAFSFRVISASTALGANNV